MRFRQAEAEAARDSKEITQPDAPEAETKAVTEPLPAPKQDEDAATVLTEECLGTPKLAEVRPRQSPSYEHTQARPEITFAYYPFLCINNLSSLRTDDINYLESQGCLRVPESSCLDDLVRAFFRYAHPILPVVNEAEFWSIYDPLTSGSRASQIPVILLSAMLFVACKYVDDCVIQNMQLNTAHEARDRFLRKTQILYDQETESSPAVLAQVSLLLTHWSPQISLRTSKQSTKWLGRAIHHCQDAISQAKLWTALKGRSNEGNLIRLLRCCILSDCIHSLYTRRPLMMPPGMVEAERLSPMLSRGHLSYEIGRSRVYGVEEKQQFIEVQEQISALVTILSRVMAMVYPQEGTTIYRNTPSLSGVEHELHDCKNRLKTWYNESLMLSVCDRDSALGSPTSMDDGREHEGSQYDPVGLLVSMMYLHYETAMLALCHSELMRLMANPPVTYPAYRLHERFSIQKQKQDLLNCILECMIFCTALPLILHLLNTEAHKENDSSLSHEFSPPTRQQAVTVQCSRYPDWVRKVTQCLRLHFREELEYILQAAKAVNKYLAQVFQESYEAQLLSTQEEEVSQPNEEQLHMCNWRELLDTRPIIYAGLIKTLDTVITWGGPLNEADMGASFNEYQAPPVSGLIRQCRGRKASVALNSTMSAASSRRSIEKRPQSTSCSDELAAQSEAVDTDPGLLPPEVLCQSSSDIVMQKLDFLQSCQLEVPRETHHPTSLDSLRGWTEEIADGVKPVLGQVASHENIQLIDLTDAEDMVLEDEISDDWIDALLEKDILS
ncbi:hypothetical protein HG530_011664 [Fusarium avenaceum]|nr:hypothetical protein HG530_011664 [Fusarium avenaceum]